MAISNIQKVLAKRAADNILTTLSFAGFFSLYANGQMYMYPFEVPLSAEVVVEVVRILNRDKRLRATINAGSTNRLTFVRIRDQ